jgi:hypothetical protein
MSEKDLITTSVHATHALTPAQWEEIWLLTAEFYDVERDYAEDELRRRQRIAMFRMNDALLGIAAIDIDPEEFRGRKIVVISTAHVLIRENWRGRNLVQKLGLRTFLGARLRYPLRPIYWFFDTFSYKGYLLLRAISALSGLATRRRRPSRARHSSISSLRSATDPPGARPVAWRCAPDGNGCGPPPHRWSCRPMPIRSSNSLRAPIRVMQRVTC